MDRDASSKKKGDKSVQVNIHFSSFVPPRIKTGDFIGSAERLEHGNVCLAVPALQFWRFYFASLVLRLLIPSFVPGGRCSLSLCWLPQGVLLFMILHLSCQSGWDTSSSSLQRSCAGMGAGRRVLCLSIDPHSSLGLCEGWRQMVLPAGALPAHLSLFSLLPEGRDGTWHLWRGLGAV